MQNEDLGSHLTCAAVILVSEASEAQRLLDETTDPASRAALGRMVARLADALRFVDRAAALAFAHEGLVDGAAAMEDLVARRSRLRVLDADQAANVPDQGRGRTVTRPRREARRGAHAPRRSPALGLAQNVPVVADGASEMEP